MQRTPERCSRCSDSDEPMKHPYDYRYAICVADGRCWYKFDKALIDLNEREAAINSRLLVGVSPIAACYVKKPKWRVLLGRVKHWWSGLFVKSEDY